MTRRFTRNVARETPAPIVHVQYSSGARSRTWCGRLAAQQDNVISGDPAAIGELVPGGRVCSMCARSRAKHYREL